MVAPVPEHETSLTGRTRHRPGWLGKFVLQVEVRIELYDPWGPPPPRPGAPADSPLRPRVPRDTWHVWRDARWHDIDELKERHAL